MSIDLFIMLFGIGSVVASLVTEALKKNFKNVSSNVIALIVAVGVGGVGTLIYYILLELPLTPLSYLYALLMAICVWLGAMVGYDKVMQTLKQIRG